MMNSSEYINKERRDFSLYVAQSRAIPHAADGLKAAARRVLWTARDGRKYKSATLAGATMPIHPHQSPEGAVNTLAAPYGNNIPLLDGDGAFGTLLTPTAYGAARYTSVKISEFTKDVIFKDLEIVPLQDNYDGTLKEPKFFLPLIPTVLLNPQEGIAVGFATTILPRSLQSIIESQINYLRGKPVRDALPHHTAINQRAIGIENGRYVFVGEFTKKNATTIIVTNLPYGITHEKYIEKLFPLQESGLIVDIEDNSRDAYSIEIKFKKGVLRSKSEDDVVKMLHLRTTVTENLNVIDFDGETVWTTTFCELIEKFCDWRLEWYVARYQRLLRLLEQDIQRYKDIIRAINRNIGAVAKKTKSRTELKQYLRTINIVNIDYISDLPIYRLTEHEKQKTQRKLDQALETQKHYKDLLKHKSKRKEVYISELKQVLKKYK